jgi:hypothetical protein
VRVVKHDYVVNYQVKCSGERDGCDHRTRDL